MKFHPDIHHRRSIRLKNFDYSGNGAYFVTLCTHDRSCCFEQFEQLRGMVEAQWQNLPKRFLCVALDAYIIMPNHFHGIIVIGRDTPCGYPDSGHEQEGPPQQEGHPQGVPLRNPAIGEIVGAFKSLCVNAWLKIIKDEKIDAIGKFWQKNYYEHVIRNDGELERIRRYIVENPLKWDSDRENPSSKKAQQPPLSEQWMV
jgi:REP element-mobilizing transposase RayT